MSLDEELFSPTGRKSHTDTREIAPRLESLDGVSVGLLSNGKQNAVTLLNFLAQLLQERNGAGEVILWEKEGASVPAPDPMLSDMKARARLVLTGLGD